MLSCNVLFYCVIPNILLSWIPTAQHGQWIKTSNVFFLMFPTLTFSFRKNLIFQTSCIKPVVVVLSSSSSGVIPSTWAVPLTPKAWPNSSRPQASFWWVKMASKNWGCCVNWQANSFTWGHKRSIKRKCSFVKKHINNIVFMYQIIIETYNIVFVYVCFLKRKTTLNFAMLHYCKWSTWRRSRLLDCHSIQAW